MFHFVKRTAEGPPCVEADRCWLLRYGWDRLALTRCGEGIPPAQLAVSWTVCLSLCLLGNEVWG